MIRLVLLFCLAAAAATAQEPAASPRPNIVFFLVDDMGWQDTSVPFLHDAAGEPVVTPLNRLYRTPNMVALAERGMKFTNAYAMPVCTPSRNCWVTGLNSARHHVTNWTNLDGTDTTQNTTRSHRSPAGWLKNGLPRNRVTLPSLLQSAGYRTIHAGKAHFGSSAYARDPKNFGFDLNIAGSNIGHPGSYTGDYGKDGDRPVPGLADHHHSGTFLTDAITLETNKAIAAAVAEKIPFFAYVSHYAVHAPFQIDQRFAANYPGLEGGRLGYATLLEGMDQSLGDLMAKLEQLGVAENTLIVFMSDNGGDAPSPDVNQSNAPLRHKKGSKYEGGVRVPLIVAWARPDPTHPAQASLPIPTASREDDLVAIFDLFPTFAKVAGIPVASNIDGVDLSPYLRGEPGNHRPQELLIHFPHDHRSTYFTIFREGPWKLIHNYADSSYELYNLESDLSETHDLAAKETDRTLAMATRMGDALKDAGAQWPRQAVDDREVQIIPPAGKDSPR
jgi:arylsulfatase A-like enzyme